MTDHSFRQADPGIEVSVKPGMAHDAVSDEPRKSSEDAVEAGPLDVHPPEGEQERSAESDETLSPDEKFG